MMAVHYVQLEVERADTQLKDAEECVGETRSILRAKGLLRGRAEQADNHAVIID
jgi:hypothetical protein